MDKHGMLTRSGAAAALGVTPKTLAMWERRGRIKPPERDWRGWRWYSADDISSIRSELLGGAKAEPAVLPIALDVSAENRLPGTVHEINGDSLVSEVVLLLEGGQLMTAVISNEAVRRLGLKVGGKAVAFISAMDVMIGQ